MLYPAVLSHREEQQSYQDIKLNSQNWHDSKWQRDAHNCAPRHALCSRCSHVKQAINMPKFSLTGGHIHPHTCRWCRHSPCRSHSFQCPVRSCMNVFCWKAQRWHIRGKIAMVCVCVRACPQTYLGYRFPCWTKFLAHTSLQIHQSNPLWNHPWSFFNERSPLQQLRKPWVTISLHAWNNAYEVKVKSACIRLSPITELLYWNMQDLSLYGTEGYAVKKVKKSAKYSVDINVMSMICITLLRYQLSLSMDSYSRHTSIHVYLVLLKSSLFPTSCTILVW